MEEELARGIVCESFALAHFISPQGAWLWGKEAYPGDGWWVVVSPRERIREMNR